MKTRLLILALFAYNCIVTHIPSFWVRGLFLYLWLRRVGAGTFVQMRCRFLSRNVRFGERNVVNFGCLIDGREFSVETGTDVSIGPCATILTLGHNPQSCSFASRGGPVRIGNRAWIGYGAIVLPNVSIGEGAVVGAGSVVTKDVDPFAIVAGNPARKIGERNNQLNYRLHFKPWLH